MVTITFNPVLVADLQAIGQGLPAACVSGGIATYSGVSLALGTAPSVDTACLTRLGGMPVPRVRGFNRWWSPPW